ncbi:MAG: tRNA (N(6)-L-threonylcarbamoyladenosine(37)-C(2))-methylthiotransferase MtaB [Firmicutes bacterium]|nr:tRNA (N(6)-L-threonylcarbamoyladenosine(37)-C(2))-methylthiotransferase MtaB [Bacillota bacterium]
MSKSVAAHTLGCKVNQHETESLLEMFRRRGYEVVDFDSPASVYIINTCTVTHLGDRKSRQVIRQAAKRNPEAKVVVTGCYAQRAPEEIAGIPGVSLILGNRGRDQLVDLVEGISGGDSGKEDALTPGPRRVVSDISRCREFEELPFALERGRTRAMVKVQEGCSQFCSYCIVPYTRGPVRSRREEEIIREIAALVENGYREVVLTGIHTSAYGQDRIVDGKREADLATLVEDILLQVPDLPRLRISSVEPVEVPDAIPDLMNRHPTFCRHLHLPLQSGDDRVLKMMRRPYTSSQYAAVVEGLRRRVEGLAVTADIMVGFPGETDQNFENSYRLVRDLGLSDLHVFKYSPRPGTPAAALSDQVPPPVKEERSKALLELAGRLRRDFARGFLGTTRGVLIEQQVPGKKQRPTGGSGTAVWEGYTDNYLRVAVEVPGGEDARGRLARVKLTGLGWDMVLGEII